jgi:hypothetical protein
MEKLKKEGWTICVLNMRIKTSSLIKINISRLITDTFNLTAKGSMKKVIKTLTIVCNNYVCNNYDNLKISSGLFCVYEYL